MSDHYYGGESNPLNSPSEYHKVDRSLKVYWTDPRLASITRLRLLSDPGYPAWDVSYAHGELKDGTPCTVSLPFDQLPKKEMRHAIIVWAKRDGVYAKGLGIFNAISTLI